MRPALALLLAVAVQGHVWRPQDVPLPAVALDAAAAGAVPLAYVLARFGVPTGLVTTENPGDKAYAWTAPRLGEPKIAKASESASRLMGAHPRYRAVWSEGVLSIVEVGALCDAPLDQPRPDPVVIDGDLSRALLLLSWMAGDTSSPARGTTAPPPGAVPPPPQLPQLKVTVGQGATLRDAFDQAVRVSGGGVWIVWQHDLPAGRVGCRSVGFYPNGQVGASATDFKVIDTTASSSHEAPLLPKLRGHVAEFLNEGSSDRLGILYPPTCVGLRYGRHRSR